MNYEPIGADLSWLSDLASAAGDTASSIYSTKKQSDLDLESLKTAREIAAMNASSGIDTSKYGMNRTTAIIGVGLAVAILVLFLATRK
jgi:hypothetical protein